MNVKPLLKAIDAYIAKADEELEETFEEEGGQTRKIPSRLYPLLKLALQLR